MNDSKCKLWFSAGIISCSLVSSTETRAEMLVRHPYLQSTTPNSTYIVWTTDVEAASEVRYGLSPNDLKDVVRNDILVKQHEIKISGLSPNTRYYYTVGSPGNTLTGSDRERHFDTAPTPGTPHKFRAWIVGDSGDGGLRQMAVRDAMLAYAGPYKPQLFLHLGDIAYNSGTTEELTSRFFNMYPNILQNTTCWPTLGNHEGVTSDSGLQTGPYYTAYVLPKGGEMGGIASGTEAYYSFDYANVHFIILDSHDSSRAVDGAMLTWMKADLASTNQEWIVAYWHHPPYSKGTHNSDLEAQLIEMRTNALPILEAGGVDLVLSGHSHLYERSYLIDGAYDTPTTAPGHIVNPGDGKPLGNGPYTKSAGNMPHEGAVYVVAGHGGVPASGLGGHPVMYFSEMANGSCILDVQGNRLSLVNLRWDRVVTDRFSLLKGPGLVLGAPEGGEMVEYGSPFDIRWSTVGNVDNVNLEYSLDDGQTYQAIASSLPNTGSYTWTVPQIDSKRATVRVSDAANAAMFDESNMGFSFIGGLPEEIVPLGSVWSYSDDGKDQGIAWLAANFDDSTWKSGKAQFGYGEADQATTLTDVEPNHPSVYFRKKITLDRPVTKAELTVLHDDGIVVWINGRQVLSKYVGDPGFAAFALAQSAPNEKSTSVLSLEPNPFFIGENVIAVMVKQVDATSPALSFDLSLTVRKSLNGSTSSSNGAGGMGGSGGDGQGGTNAGGADRPRESASCAYRDFPAEHHGAYWVWGIGLIFAARLRRSKSAVH